MPPHPGTDGDRPDLDSYVAVGVIRRPHGIRGEASVELLTDSAARFDELSEVMLVSPDRSRFVESKITGARAHQARVLVSFEGIVAPEDVARFREWTVEIPESEARETDEDEFFLHDLVGLAVIAHDGREIGQVRDVVEAVGQTLLRVDRSGGGFFDLPFAEAYCVEIDLGTRRLTVDLPDGLETLNDPEDGNRGKRSRGDDEEES